MLTSCTQFFTVVCMYLSIYVCMYLSIYVSMYVCIHSIFMVVCTFSILWMALECSSLKLNEVAFHTYFVVS